MSEPRGSDAEGIDAAGAARRELLRIAELLARRLEGEVGAGPQPPWGRGVAMGADGVARCVVDLITEYRERRDPGAAERLGAAASGAGARLSPLEQAIEAFDLRRGELDVLGCALAVEADARFGRIFAFLNDHAQKTCPTLGLASSLAAETPVALLDRPIFAAGLVAVTGDGPLPERVLRLDIDVVRHLMTGEARRPEREGVVVCAAAPSLDELLLPDALRRDAARYVELARRRLEAGDPAPLLIVAGATGAGRKALARAIFGAMRWATVETSRTSALVMREIAFHRAALVATVGPASVDDALRAGTFARAIAVVASPEDLPAITGGLDREHVVVELSEPGVEDRSRLYRALVGASLHVEDAAVDALAAKVRFGPRAMREVVRRAALAAAHAPNGEAPSTGAQARHLAEACRAVGHVTMDGLAQRLPTAVTREDLVVPEKLRAELDFAVAWIRHQRTVFGAWRLDRRLPHGVGLAALFAGPPGTGKTLAAQVLAAELEMLAYRVDLSQVVSKFIGETEKNLKTVFDRARAAGAILFFDEADALFGKRSEVKEAHDRYANMEVGYLLQRIEAYDGVTVLATNRLRDLDPAFVRRFQIIADFPLPGPSERHQIWSALLRDVPLAREVDLERLAREAEVSGGEIKNAVVAAAFFAAGEGAVVRPEHLRRALVRELAKNGKVSDAERLRGK